MSATLRHTTPHAPVRSPSLRGHGRVPWPPLIALALSGVVGLLFLAPGRPDDPARPLAVRTLDVRSEPGGGIALLDTGTGAVAGRVPAEGDSFIRGVLHSTERIRRVHGVPPDAPYRLEQLSNGRLVLVDTGSNLAIDLEAFGDANAGAFAALLDGAEPAR